MIKVFTENAPKAIGPYSQAIKANGLVFCSGQIPLDPKTLQFDPNLSIKDQTKLALDNLSHVLKAAGSGMEKVVKTTVFLKDMNDFAEMNEVYAQYFPHCPARSTIEVARLPRDVKFEVECVALADN